MRKSVRILVAGLIGTMLLTSSAYALTLREVAIAAARVDRTDKVAVMEVQTGLQEFGLYSGEIDGIFGRQTYDAAVAAVEQVNAEAAAQAEQSATQQTFTDQGGGSDNSGSGVDIAEFGPTPSGPSGSVGSAGTAESEGGGAAADPSGGGAASDGGVGDPGITN